MERTRKRVERDYTDSIGLVPVERNNFIIEIALRFILQFLYCSK